MSEEDENRQWDGTVHASEIHSYLGCKRKYWRRYSGKEPSPEKPSQRLGKNIHAILASYLEIGSFEYPTETIVVPYKVRDEQREAVYTPESQVTLAQAAMPHLPKPGECVTEVPFHFSFEGVEFAGTIDALRNTVPEVIDHKSTANLVYAKTTKQLKQDPQVILYDRAALIVFEGYRTVDNNWSYIQTRTKIKHRSMPFALGYLEIEAGMKELAEIGREITRLHVVQPDWLSFPPTPAECPKYSGCPYRADCTDVSELDVAIAVLNEKNQKET
jgi:hypothetical protein